MHVGAVEVDGRTCWGVIKRAGKSKDIPQKRARGGDLVYIEAGVDEQFGIEDGIPQASISLGQHLSFRGEYGEYRDIVSVPPGPLKQRENGLGKSYSHWPEVSLDMGGFGRGPAGGNTRYSLRKEVYPQESACSWRKLTKDALREKRGAQ